MEGKKVKVYYLKNDKLELELIMYAADWCGPCNRIKPNVLETFCFFGDEIRNKSIENILPQEELNLSEYKNKINNTVPFFILEKKNDDKNSTEVKIFTEKFEYIKNFLDYYNEQQNDF